MASDPFASTTKDRKSTKGTAAGSNSAGAKVWHVGRQDGNQSGPFSVDELRCMLANGEILQSSLVWRQGMDEWKPAAEVEEIREVATLQPSSAALLARSAMLSIARSRDLLNPRMLCLIGRACGVLALLFFVLSVSLAFFGFSWFTGTLLFAALFLLGEGFSQVLDRLEQIAASVAAREEP